MIRTQWVFLGLFKVICILGCHSSRNYYPVYAHAHNDYEQQYPITTAIEHHFHSLEVDIVYHDGKIIVSHDEEALDTKPEFEVDYLQPFLAHASPDEFYILLVDIKNYSDALIIKLNSILDKYSARFYNRSDDISISKKILIMLSGDIPRQQLIENNQNSFLFIDGRIDDLEYDYSQYYMPLISMNLAHVSAWQGETQPTVEDLQNIKRVINKVHQEGKWIRFWNTPDKRIVWNTLVNQGVDFIAVDDIQAFYKAFEH